MSSALMALCEYFQRLMDVENILILYDLWWMSVWYVQFMDVDFSCLIFLKFIDIVVIIVISCHEFH